MQTVAGIKVEFALPCDELREFVSAYHIFDTGPISNNIRHEAFFPGWANLRFRDPNAKLSISIPNNHIENTPLHSLFGPSSFLSRCSLNGGRLIGAGLTPIGFSRIFGPNADKYANTIVDFSNLLPKFPLELIYEIHKCSEISEVAQILDIQIQKLIKRPHRHEEIARTFWKMINDNHNLTIEEIASDLKLEDHFLRRISKRFFGFAPKILLRRTRFLKSIVKLVSQPEINAIEAIESDYFDYSHFVKDCHEFFGMSPRDFIELDAPVLKLSFQKRAQVLGAPVQSLHRPK